MRSVQKSIFDISRKGRKAYSIMNDETPIFEAEELFDKGYHIEDLEFVEVYPAIVDVWVEEYHYWTGVKPEDLIGFTAGFSLQLGDTHSPSNPRYTVVVNVTTGKVVWVAEPGQGPDGTTITTVITP